MTLKEKNPRNSIQASCKKHKQETYTAHVIGEQLRGNPLETFSRLYIGDDKILDILRAIS